MLSQIEMHMMRGGGNLLMMRSIVPPSSKSPILSLPVQPVGQRLYAVRRNHHKLESLQEVTVGQRGFEANETLLQTFLPFPYLQGKHHRREQQLTFNPIKIVAYLCGHVVA